MFPNETKETYFTPYYKDGNNITPMRGKSYDKFCNLKKIIRQININPTNISPISDDNAILIDSG